MKAGGGKRKGSGFERLIAKDLSLWISKGQRNDIFWRTHSSGSLGTNRRCKLEYGDIMAIDDAGKPLTDKYNIECRCGKFIKIADLVYKTGNMMQFLEEGIRNATESGRRPVWIFREHSKPIMVMCYRKDIQYLSFESCYIPQFDIIVMPYEDWKKEFKL